MKRRMLRLGVCALALCAECEGGISLSPTFSIGAVENQNGYLSTRMQTMESIGAAAQFRQGLLHAGLRLEAGRFDEMPCASGALDAGLSLPVWRERIRIGIWGGPEYNGYKFTHWYARNSSAEEYNHFISPMAGGDVEWGRWSLGGEYLFDSHLIWKARIGFRMLGEG
ncbi:MAG: hypothetical protein ABI036_09090 [Fibrobacteria bacterium]